MSHRTSNSIIILFYDACTDVNQQAGGKGLEQPAAREPSKDSSTGWTIVLQGLTMLRR